MATAFVFVTGFTLLANAFFAFADFIGARFVLRNSAEVGVPTPWLPVLGTLKALGAAGLLLGLLGIRLIGEAAALGLVLFFVGAIVAHVRARVFHNIAFPGAGLVLASASLALAITH